MVVQHGGKMNYLVWILLVLYVLIGIGISISKKSITNSTGEITLNNAFKIKTWLKLFLNPWTILTLGVSFGLFAISLWTFSLTEANNIILASMIVGLPMTILNIFLNNRILGENVVFSQYVPMGIIILGYGLMVTGVWIFVGGIK